MNDKIKISNIEIKLNDKKLNLTIEDAKALYQELAKIFNEILIALPVIRECFPYYPPSIYEPFITYSDLIEKKYLTL